MSRIERITIPMITNVMAMYSFVVSFSFRKILDKIADKIQYDPTIGAAMVELPDMAKT